MKKIVITMWCLFAYTGANSQANKPHPDPANLKSTSAEPKYEMKQYWFMMLIKGANKNHDSGLQR